MTKDQSHQNETNAADYEPKENTVVAKIPFNWTNVMGDKVRDIKTKKYISLRKKTGYWEVLK